MGTSIISGLTFATFLTLVIVPVMYSVFDSLSVRLKELFSSNQDEKTATTAGDGFTKAADQWSTRFPNEGSQPDPHSKGAETPIEE